VLSGSKSCLRRSAASPRSVSRTLAITASRYSWWLPAARRWRSGCAKRETVASATSTSPTSRALGNIGSTAREQRRGLTPRIACGCINGSARQLLGPEARAGSLLGELRRGCCTTRTLAPRRTARPLRHAVRRGPTAAANRGDLRRARTPPACAGDRFPRRHEPLAERVQQTKLAALGRLSASIATRSGTRSARSSHARSCSPRPPDKAVRSGATEIMTGNAEARQHDHQQRAAAARREATRPERLYVGEWAPTSHRSLRDTAAAAGRLRLAMPNRRSGSPHRPDASAADRLEPVRQRGTPQR